MRNHCIIIIVIRFISIKYKITIFYYSIVSLYICMTKNTSTTFSKCTQKACFPWWKMALMFLKESNKTNAIKIMVFCVSTLTHTHKLIERDTKKTNLFPFFKSNVDVVVHKWVAAMFSTSLSLSLCLFHLVPFLHICPCSLGMNSTWQKYWINWIGQSCVGRASECDWKIVCQSIATFRYILYGI